ncbi:uncharacterized protein LOC109852986 isoform X3 [Pseudomyrmex gracilis]|uniref:uncharacterized protein LOC109852986 isoform X3 n=1 Tax=Pseudomyrmex gracilis TaxID=219809 RepID=UPI00099589B6|nr:uncharacterized protein LOC109852986 isoform X3 [Pseudomyrmex gracilis]
MFPQKTYFSQLSRSYPILKLFDIYNRQSFIRAHVLDNVYICILMCVVFYASLWYANNIIKRIEKSNEEMSRTVAENKTKLNRLILLKNKKKQFEEVIVKTTDTQKITTNQLKDEMCRLSAELNTTSEKLDKLEKIIAKYKTAGESLAYSTGVVAYSTVRESEYSEGDANSFKKIKVLEPSFPPSVPSEPPPRKYGIFVSRPFEQRGSPSGGAPATPTPKIGLK